MSTTGRPDPSSAGQELLARARAELTEGRPEQARQSIVSAVTSDDALPTWLTADRLLARVGEAGARRTCRLAVLSSHTSGQLTAALRVACAVHGIAVSTYESDYRTFEQEILDPDSGLYAFQPDAVLIAADQREVRLPEVSADPEADLAGEVDRWTGLWERLRAATSALVLQLTFVPPLTDALGAHGAVHPGGRRRLLRRLNLELGTRALVGTHLVDLEAVAYQVGRDALDDPRYWYRSKHAIGLGATTATAAAVADTLAATLGWSRKLVVLDLDNTLWGGVIGEDGLGGLELGDGARGEAFVEVQRYLRSLKQRGLLLAVASKNNDADARLPFERHPDMVLQLDDLVGFSASWDQKATAVEQLAQDLDLGLDAVVFVDDNPAERAAMRHTLPQVGVVELPPEPSGYVAAIAAFPGLQTTGVTDEDLRRTSQYQARSQAKALQRASGSRQDYLAELQMTATVEPLDETNTARIAQLIGKTNQFNLTGRRHSAAAVQEFADTPRGLVWGLRLRDRFDDHGLVAVLIGAPSPQDPAELVLDTFVMSCRVLARTVEQALLDEAAGWAREQSYRSVLGHFVPTDRNAPARSVLPDSGFRAVPPDGRDPLPGVGDDAADAVESWRLDLAGDPSINPGYVSVTRRDPKEQA